MAVNIGSIFAQVGLRFDGLDTDINKVSRKFERLGYRLSLFGYQFSHAISTPLMNLGKQALETSTKFETAMSQIATITDQNTWSMAQSEAVALRLAKVYGIDLPDASKGLYDALSSGIKTSQVEEFMDAAAKAAKGGATTISTAVDGLTTVINSYGMQASEALTVSDQMFVAIKLGKATFEDLSRSMALTAPIAAATGVSFQELMGMTAAMTAQGYTAPQAFSRVNAAITALIKPNEKLTELYDQLGIASGEVLIRQFGLTGSLDMLSDVTNRNQQELAQLLGTTEALSTISALVGPKLQGTKDAIAQVGQSAGATENAVSIMMKTLQSDLDKLRGSWQSTMVGIGKDMDPELRKLVGHLNAILDAFNNLSPETRKWIVELGAFLAVIGPVALALGAVATALSKVMSAAVSLFRWLRGLTGLWTVMGQVLTGLEVILTSVYTWIIALGLGLGYLLSDLEIFQGIGNVVGEIWIFWTQGLSDVDWLLKELTYTFKNLPSLIKEMASALWDWLVAALDAVADRISNLLDWFGELFGLIGSAPAGAAGGANNFGGARAMGGNVETGKTYLVGERGPELFTPPSTGSIVPNNRLGSDSQVVLNLTIQPGLDSTVRAEIQNALPRLEKTLTAALARASQNPRNPLGRVFA